MEGPVIRRVGTLYDYPMWLSIILCLFLLVHCPLRFWSYVSLTKVRWKPDRYEVGQDALYMVLDAGLQSVLQVAGATGTGS